MEPLPKIEERAGDPARLVFLPRCPKPNPNPMLDVELEANAGGGDFGRFAAEAKGEDEEANASKPVRF